MKNQALFSSKDKSKKLKCRLLQFLFGAFRVNFLTAFFVYSFTGGDLFIYLLLFINFLLLAL